MEKSAKKGFELGLVEDLSVSAASFAHRLLLGGVFDPLRTRRYADLVAYSWDRLSHLLADGPER